MNGYTFSKTPYTRGHVRHSQNIKQLMGEKSIRCVRQCMRANLDLHVNEYLNEGHYTHCEFLGSINLF